jgi:hypothetical protein
MLSVNITPRNDIKGAQRCDDTASHQGGQACIISPAMGGAELMSVHRHVVGTGILTILLVLKHCTENSKQIFPEMKLCGLFRNSYIHVSVTDLYNPRWVRLFLLQQDRWTYRGKIYCKSLTDT